MREGLEYLRARARLAAEVRARLISKGFDEEDVEAVMHTLVARRLIDDRRTIEEVVERSAGKRARGRQALGADLEERGAPRELVAQALASAPDSEAERAEQALRAHFAIPSERGKMGRFLMARGFEEEAVEVALDRYAT